MMRRTAPFFFTFLVPRKYTFNLTEKDERRRRSDFSLKGGRTTVMPPNYSELVSTSTKHRALAMPADTSKQNLISKSNSKRSTCMYRARGISQPPSLSRLEDFFFLPVVVIQVAKAAAAAVVSRSHGHGRKR
jgi:hypothetical protein